jgi:hypothetical protein
MVTVMVQQIKLTWGLVANFPDPSAEPVLQANGLFEMERVLGLLSGCRIGQNRAETCKSGAKAGRKWELFATSFIKTCQVR